MPSGAAPSPSHPSLPPTPSSLSPNLSSSSLPTQSTLRYAPPSSPPPRVPPSALDVFSWLLAAAHRWPQSLAVVDAECGDDPPLRSSDRGDASECIPSPACLTFSALLDRSVRLAVAITRAVGDGARSGADGGDGDAPPPCDVSLAHGVVVGVLLPNCADAAAVHFACAAARCVVANFNTHSAAPELRAQLGVCRPAVVVAHACFAPTLLPALAVDAADQARLPRVLWVGGMPPAAGRADLFSMSFDDAIQAVSDADAAAALASLPLRAGDDPFQLLFTSGTTASSSSSSGGPKGVLLTSLGVAAHAAAAAEECRLSRFDVYLHAAPLFHLVTAFALFACPLVGARQAMLGRADRFSAARFCSTVEAERVSVTNVASAQVALVAASPAASARDLSSLRLVSCGGAPLDAAALRAVVSRCGCPFFHEYGCTEAGGKITVALPSPSLSAAVGCDEKSRAKVAPAELERRLAFAGSAGRPFAGVTVHLLKPGVGGGCGGDDAAAFVPVPAPGSVSAAGEVVVRGVSVIPRYFSRAGGGVTATDDGGAGCFVDGFFRTGDVGVWDATSCDASTLVLLDRVKDTILVGGENVFSSEVEAALRRHPGVKAAAVFGVADVLLGQAVAAAVVLRPGTSDDSADDIVSPSALGAHCRALIAGYKAPSFYAFLPALPRTALGKVRKVELRRLAAEGGLRLASEADGAAAAAAAAATRPPAEEAPLSPDDADSLLRSQVAAALSSLLSRPVPPASHATPLAELGLDSRGAALLRTALETLVSRHLPSTLAFDHNTVDKLVAALSDSDVGSDAEEDGGDDTKKAVDPHFGGSDAPTVAQPRCGCIIC